MYCRNLQTWNPLNQQNVYSPISLNTPSPFGGGIKSKAVTLSLLSEGYSLKVGSLTFGSPVSASAVSNPIFEINSTEDKTKMFTPMFSGLGKKTVSFGSMAARASPKISSGGFSDYYSTSGSRDFKFG